MGNYTSCYDTLQKELQNEMENFIKHPNVKSLEIIDKVTEVMEKVGKMCGESHTDSYSHSENYEDNKPVEMTAEMYKHWADNLENSDGTYGAHWTKEQTTSIAKNMGVKFDHINEWAFWIAMNAMYADYYYTAKKYGVDKPEFYADMAKSFLFDEDASGTPMEKLSAYYHYIVK